MNEAPPPIAPLTPPPPPAPESQARTWNMFCHLSALAGFIGVPLGTLLGPFIIWQIKKNEIPSVEIHGKAALNFQITILLAVLVTFIVGFILSFFCIGYLFFLLIAPIALCGLIFAIVAAVKANNGEDYKYPYSLELLK
jgi:uncharacterized Tic20 family protein